MNTDNHNLPENKASAQDEKIVKESSEPAAEPPASKAGSYTMGILCHLLSFCIYLFPFGNLVGPLFLWLVKKDEDSFVYESGKEVLNFQISLTLYAFISVLLIFAFGLGILLLVILGLSSILFTIIGAIKASEGTVYRYPLSIRFIK
jgi:uncharacterized Tic20 family protein